jgi:ketosteroid isomerase-like protein
VSDSPSGVESERLRAFRIGTDRFMEAFNEGDYERAFSGTSEDFEQIFPAGFIQERLVGRRAAIEFFEDFRNDVGAWQLRAKEYIEAGSSTFIVGYETQGVGQASGISGGWREWDVVEVDEEGRTRRIRQFWDRDDALAAAEGVASEPEEKPA